MGVFLYPMHTANGLASCQRSFPYRNLVQTISFEIDFLFVHYPCPSSNRRTHTKLKVFFWQGVLLLDES